MLAYSFDNFCSGYQFTTLEHASIFDRNFSSDARQEDRSARSSGCSEQLVTDAVRHVTLISDAFGPLHYLYDGGITPLVPDARYRFLSVFLPDQVKVGEPTDDDKYAAMPVWGPACASLAPPPAATAAATATAAAAQQAILEPTDLCLSSVVPVYLYFLVNLVSSSGGSWVVVF